MDTEMGLNFKCDYANAVLDEIWEKSVQIMKCNREERRIRVDLGLLERKALEAWLHQRGGYASMLTLPGMGPPGCAPSVFGFPITYVKMDSHIRVKYL